MIILIISLVIALFVLRVSEDSVSGMAAFVAFGISVFILNWVSYLNLKEVNKVVLLKCPIKYVKITDDSVFVYYTLKKTYPILLTPVEKLKLIKKDVVFMKVKSLKNKDYCYIHLPIVKKAYPKYPYLWLTFPNVWGKHTLLDNWEVDKHKKIVINTK
jgi:hypothetical protein